MRKFGVWAATVVAAGMLLASPFAQAGSPQGVCQAGGVNRVRLTDAMAKYWSWYYGGTGSQQIGNLFLVPLPTNGVQISDDPLIVRLLQEGRGGNDERIEPQAAQMRQEGVFDLRRFGIGRRKDCDASPPPAGQSGEFRPEHRVGIAMGTANHHERTQRPR